MALDFLYEYMEIKKNLQRKVPIFDAIMLIVAAVLVISGNIMSEFVPERWIGLKKFSPCLILIGFALIIFFAFKLNNKQNDKSLNKEHKVIKKELHKNIRILLEKYGINYRNDEEVDALIRLVRSQSGEYDFLKDIILPAQRLMSIGILPLLTVVVNEVLKNTSIEQLVLRFSLLLLIIILSAVTVWGIYIILDLSCNKTKHIYEQLIIDLEQVKVFKNMNVSADGTDA